MDAHAAAKTLLKMSGEKQCSNCRRVGSPQWRKGPSGAHVCNACGVFYMRHGEFSATHESASAREIQPRLIEQRP